MSTRILCDLDLKYIDGRDWQLIADFIVESVEAKGTIEVPAGALTDFNSTPIGLWNILPPTEYGEAAVLHDFLYRTGLLRGDPVTRDVADRVHREFVRFRQAPAWKVFAMYAGLRAFGWVTWNRYRKAEAPASV